MSLSKLSPTLSTKGLFLKACAEGKLGLVRELLANGADVNWQRDEENCPVFKGGSGLHLAAIRGHQDWFGLLLSQPGIEVNIKSNYSQTPLMLACLLGRENIVRRLLQVPGIQLNCQDNGGQTALHLAVSGCKSGCVQQLREAPGLDWNVKESSGLTPLLMAADLGKAECLQVFLTVPQPHLDLTSTDRNGYNVAWLAVKGSVRSGDRLRCVELLSRDPRVDWNTRDQAGDTPLLFCLKNNRIGLAKILLDNPLVSLDVKDVDGKYPENIARELNLREILDLMWTGGRIKERLSECPVCYEKFSRTSEVHHCQMGHFICGDCRPRVQFCPTCRGKKMGRAHGFEEQFKKLDI